jgi:hypothetical protein
MGVHPRGVLDGHLRRLDPAVPLVHRADVVKHPDSPHGKAGFLQLSHLILKRGQPFRCRLPQVGALGNPEPGQGGLETILRPAVDDHLRAPAKAVHIDAEQPDRVYRRGAQQQAVGGYAAVAGLEADDATECRRPDHRTHGLRAQGQLAEAGGHRRRRAARGVLCGVWIRRGAGFEVGELGGHGLAEHETAGASQGSHARRLTVAGKQGWGKRRAGAGDEPVGVQDVLHSEKPAAQRRLPGDSRRFAMQS